MENILESLRTADKLRTLREADQQQQQAQQTAQPQQQQAPAQSNVDQAQLEKAFEAALQTVKSDIIKEVQGLMEKFGAELVKKIQGNSNSKDAASQPQQSNQQPSQEENTNGNK